MIYICCYRKQLLSEQSSLCIDPHAFVEAVESFRCSLDNLRFQYNASVDSRQAFDLPD
jgi:hypothetical protein